MADIIQLNEEEIKQQLGDLVDLTLTLDFVAFICLVGVMIKSFKGNLIIQNTVKATICGKLLTTAILRVTMYNVKGGIAWMFS